MCIAFDEAIEQTKDKDRALLIGNGFSIEHFHYRNLLEQANLADDDPLRSLFAAFDTFDFEAVIRALEQAAVVERAYQRERHAEQFRNDAQRLREALGHAIRATHPEHRENIQDRIPSCAQFLQNFGKVFSLNYDLLLYWVALALPQFRDGFGLGEELHGFRGPFREDAYCEVYNPHGALHLFQTSAGEVEKRVHDGDGIIAAITRTITHSRRIPLYVAEGSWKAKLRKINSVSYLRHCYRKLSETTGVMFIYGHSGARNDLHIYRAIFKSSVEHLFFCVHRPTTAINEIDAELAWYQRRFNPNKGYTLVDAETAQVWNRL
ncbi:DUF4917 family protein [Rhodomicrobium vannielii ATCC 17100]|uniref:DUF4917 family protein n=1 Tax=Rhodomicrobium vannielii TaxID=1069 RepID=UPI001919E00A|nr:DUF4917 family protein [Rhodomicrobium vannielii]MBJ7532877.1 DUF4917 family protein [Rhodomicrobium vannielii ATCC 17100]